MLRKLKTSSDNNYKTQSSSYSKFTKTMSPNRSTHLQLAQTTSKLKINSIQKTKKLMLPTLFKPNIQSIALEYSVQQLRLQHKQVLRKNHLLQTEISHLRVLVQSNIKENQYLLLNKLQSLQYEMDKQKQRYEIEINGQKHALQVLKQINLKLLKQNKLDQENLVNDIKNIAELRKASELVNTKLFETLNPNEKRILVYDELLFRKLLSIKTITQQLNNGSLILNQIKQLVDPQSNDHSLLPKKIQYLLKHKQNINNTKITNLQDRLLSDQQLIQSKQKQIQSLKLQFSTKIQQISLQLNSIIQSMKKQFNALKLQNWILVQQNKQLKSKIQSPSKLQKSYRSSMIQSSSQSQNKFKIKKIQSNIKLKTVTLKTGLIKTFSNWIYQWSHTKTQQNRIVLLELLLDRKEVLDDGIIKNMSQLGHILFDCLFNSKNQQIQEICIKIISSSLNKNIIKQNSLHIERILPRIIEQHSVYNEQSLKILHGFMQFKQLNENNVNSIKQNKLINTLMKNINQNKYVKQSYELLTSFMKNKQLRNQLINQNISNTIIQQLKKNGQQSRQALIFLQSLLNIPQYTQHLTTQHNSKNRITSSSIQQYNQLISFQNNIQQTIPCVQKLFDIPQFLSSIDKFKMMTDLVRNLNKQPKLQILIQQLLDESNSEDYQKVVNQFDVLIEGINKQKNLDLVLQMLAKIKNKQFNQKCTQQCMKLFQKYQELNQQKANYLLNILKLLFNRNKQTIQKYLSPNSLKFIISQYLKSSSPDPLFASIINLSIQHNKPQINQNKQQILQKLIQNVTNKNPKIISLSLKGLIYFSKQKDSLFTIKDTIKLFSYLSNIEHQQSVSYLMTLIYYLSSIPGHSQQLSNTFMSIIMKTISQFPNSKQIILKSLTLIQKVHLSNHRKYILNKIVQQPSLTSFSTINQFLIQTDKKSQIVQHAQFLYQSLLNPIPVQSLSKNISNNNFNMINQLIELKNCYSNQKLGKVVGEILKQMSRFNKSIEKQIEKVGINNK